MDGPGGFFGVHRTWLAEPGVKAPIATPKAMLGRTKGGAVRLTDAAPVVAVAEGIESALSLRDALADRPGLAVVAALSAPGIDAFEWTRGTSEVMAAVDNDASGRNAAAKLAERCAAAGMRLTSIRPERKGEDWNDMAAREVAA